MTEAESQSEIREADTEGPFSWAQQKADQPDEDAGPATVDDAVLEKCPQPMAVAAKVVHGVKRAEQGSDVYLYVDVRGVAVILPQLQVRSFLKYNMIASWAVDGDLFRLQVVEKTSKDSVIQAFITGFDKAVALKNQLWAFVNLYLHSPAAVSQLQSRMPSLKEGGPAPDGMVTGCPPFGTGTFMNPRLAGVNPVAELKRLLSSAETSKLADSVAKAVLKGGPEYARAIGEKLAAAVSEVRTARDALHAVLQERDLLRQQLAESQQKAAVAEAAAAAHGSASSTGQAATSKEQAAEVAALRAHLAELEAEVTAWRATNSNQQQQGDGRYAQLAEEYSHLEVDNTRLMQLLEDNQALLEKQVRVGKEMEAQLAQERRGRQEAEVLLAAAAERQQQQDAAQNLARGREVHGALKAVQAEARELQQQCSAVRAEAESLQTAVPLIGAYFEKELKEYMASGGFASLQDAVARYRRECRLRKQLYNQLMELRGNIRVYCRVRPPIDRERALGSESAVRFPADCNDTLSVVGELATKAFEFDRVFQPGSAQEEVFEDTRPLVQSVMDGFNVCIFAYGQTGSGKTHTMEGPAGDPGVNGRAVRELFRLGQERGEEWSVTLTVSILEIYNEQIRDLLLPDGGGGKLEVKQHPQGGVHVPGLTHRRVESPDDLRAVADLARRHRVTCTTSMNEHSSRSHSLLSVNVAATNRLTGVTTRGKLHLVDLAGSERVSKSEVEGERLKEAQAINRSLAALGDVINALATKSPHVPFRNSKLTYALQDSLGGDSKVLMFVQVSPAPDNVAETLCSLNFATRVRGVELGPARSHTSTSNCNGAATTTADPGSPASSGRGAARSISGISENGTAGRGVARSISGMSDSSSPGSPVRQGSRRKA